MNDQIAQALTRAGLSTTPLGVLAHAGSFFAVYPDQLVYHEAGRVSTVALPDVTRIHSDREGVLRVETSQRTAVTASLLGYDPGQVQAFFQQVRDVTARAKELPSVPLTKLTKQAPPAMPLSGVSLPPGGAGTGAATVPEPAGASSARPEPLVISSTPSVVPVAQIPDVPITSPVNSPVPNPMNSPIGSPAPVQGQPERVPLELTEALPVPASFTLPPVLNTAPLATIPLTPLSAEDEPPTPAGVPHVLISSMSGRDRLRARAESVQGFSGTVRLLAVVLGLAALGLTYVQYQGGEAIGALWTLLSGGVGTVALLAFAEALRLLATLGSELSAEGPRADLNDAA